LKQWEDTDLWYKKDDKFEKPKAYINMKIYTTDCGFCVQDDARVFASVWQGVQEEYLREFNYMADCANLGNSVNVMYDNIGFSWSGFNDSMPNYVNETIKKLKDMPSLDLSEMFDQTKEKLLLEWKNAYLGQSYNQAFALFDSATLSRAVEKKVLSPLLENYSYEKFKSELAQWM
jgi:secreted Zn-dependent insulinase-like peptidase